MNRVPPFKPFGDRVLVQVLPEDTGDNIVIPDAARKRPLVGKIISIGDGLRSESGELLPVRAKEGDVILFGKYAGTEMPSHPLLALPDGGEVQAADPEFLTMREEEIIGFVLAPADRQEVAPAVDSLLPSSCRVPTPQPDDSALDG